MDWVKIVLLSVTLACLGTSTNAQYTLSGEGIRLGTTLAVPRSNLQNSRSTLCYNGESLFLGYGFNSTTTVIERINASNPTAASTEIDRLPNHNSGLDCCCQYLAYGWANDTQATVTLVHLAQTNIKRQFTIAHTGTIAFPAIILDCTSQLLRIAARDILYTFDITSHSAPTQITYSDTLRLPRCVAHYNNSGTPFLISSGPGADSVEIVNLMSFAKFSLTIRVGTEEAQISCLDLDGATIYIRCRVDFSGIDYVVSASASTFVTQAAGADLTVGGGVLTQVNQLSTASTSTFVNGISMCGSCSSLACLTSTCSVCQQDSVYPQCGFCSPDNMNCICPSSEPLIGCIYEDAALATSCTRCVDAADVSLLIYNPEFQRRTPGDPGEVSVAGVSAVESTIAVARYVTVGRNSPAAWPMPKDATALTATTSPWKVGFRAPTSATLKGSRAGVFAATFTITGVAPERIPGVVIENSGFTQQFVTYTVSGGESVVLQVQTTTTQVARFVGSFRWRFTQVNEATGLSGTVSDNLGCANATNRRECTLTSVTKAGNEGVYEAYRPNRRIRNWHPIIFLSVRKCAVGKAGADCTTNCTNCINGMCDADCGTCICDPGWMGANCQTPCADGNSFGKTCALKCSTSFPTKSAAADCTGVLICTPRGGGCSCRSGLMPPSCKSACGAGFWGRSCLKACPPCAANNGCNARTGICNPAV